MQLTKHTIIYATKLRDLNNTMWAYYTVIFPEGSIDQNIIATNGDIVTQ